MDHDLRGLPLAYLLDLLAALGISVAAAASYLVYKHGHDGYMDAYVKRVGKT